MPNINAGPWPEEEFEELRKIKGHRSWERAIEEEFDVDFERFSE